MNKTFFDEFEARRREFSERAGYSTNARVELVLNSGGTYVVEQVVEASDGWVQLDVRNAAEEAELVGLSLPYYQINQVLFLKPKQASRQAGFAR
ncbi:MAG: hypothetical protein WDA27_06075 [Actinomycetota bacterium]